MSYRFTSLLVACLLSPAARAADWVVDASGAAGTLTTIDQAMLVAAPGDRILVLPGSYPAFHFSRGVDVIGLGASPADVVVARVDYHVNVPPIDYDTSLSNLTVCGSGPSDGVSTSGNELGPGTHLIEGVVMCGGVFLHGDGDFYLIVANSRFEPGPGDGFQGAAFDFGGGIFDLVDSRIQGWSASPQDGIGPGVGLRIAGDSTVRVSGSEVFGGAASEEGTGLGDGADAIERGFGSGPIAVRIAGQSLVRGGDGSPSGAGGAGVDLTASITVGDTTVSGGGGGTPGPDYAASQPTFLGYDPYLATFPARKFAMAHTFLAPGDGVLLRYDASLAGAVIGAGRHLDPPAQPHLSPLVPGEVHFFDTAPVGVMNPVAQTGSSPPHNRGIYQAFFIVPRTGAAITTNPVPVTLGH